MISDSFGLYAQMLLGNLWLQSIAGLILAVMLTLILHLSLMRIVVRKIHLFLRNTTADWEKSGVLSTAAGFVSVFVFAQILRYLPQSLPVLENLAAVALVVIAVRCVDRLFSFGLLIYEKKSISREKPLRGYAQLTKIFLYALAGVVSIAIIFDKSPLYLLSGLGAMTAVILLIFRDTILGFVAGMQVSLNKLIQLGDWVSIPVFDTDGEVIEISLHTLKVQNWDKSISMIPMHHVMTSCVKNWQGMFHSGGRRIKRALHIDMNSVVFLRDSEIKRLRQIPLLREYILEKSTQIEERFQSAHARGTEPQQESLNSEEIHDSMWQKQRTLTNLGCFRVYIQKYLRQHPQIFSTGEMSFMVRQLAPSGEGIALEIYAFSKDTAWANFENIQADIFDHLLASVGDFRLRLYQKPSGMDFRSGFKHNQMPRVRR